MTTKAYYLGNANAPVGRQLNYTDDNLSPTAGNSLWQFCPLLAIGQDPFVGLRFFDDFAGVTKAADAWIATQATTGTAIAGGLAGGTLALNSGATTQGQGMNFQRAGGAFVPAANKHIWFEARVKIGIIQTQFFVGLAEVNTAIIATNALAAQNVIGFSSVTNDAVILPQAIKAGAAAVIPTINTLLVATYARYGFFVNGLTSISYFLNGVQVGTNFTTAANIPVLAMTPSFVCQAGAGAGANATMDVDYVMAVQLR